VAFGNESYMYKRAQKCFTVTDRQKGCCGLWEGELCAEECSIVLLSM
jgi:hypothetical protein